MTLTPEQERMLNHPAVIAENKKWLAASANPHRPECGGYAIWECRAFIERMTGVSEITMFCGCFAAHIVALHTEVPHE